MIQNKSTFFLGVFIFIIPFLGLPTSWKTTLIVLSGLGLMALSFKFIPFKKNPKIRVKKEKVTPVFIEPMPAITPDDTL